MVVVSKIASWFRGVWMMVPAQLRAMVGSWLRVFVAALIAAVPTVWAVTPSHDVVSWGWSGVWAFVGAVVITAFNAVRSGDDRFGRGSAR